MTQIAPRSILPVVFVRNGIVLANSRDVAEFFEKQHSHVLRDIDTILRDAPDALSNFGEGFYTLPNTGAQRHRCFEMNIKGFSLLGMGFTGAKALRWKIQYVDAFEAMRDRIASQTPSTPQTFAQALRLAADLQEQKERLAIANQQLSDRNTILEPSHAGIRRIAEVTNEMTIDAFAKLLGLKTIKELREHCQSKGWIYRRQESGRWRAAQRYLGRYVVEKAPTVLNDAPLDKIEPTIYLTAKAMAILIRDYGRLDLRDKLNL